MARRHEQLALAIVGKLSDRRVILRRSILGRNPDPNRMLPGMYGNHLRKASLHRVAGQKSEFLFRCARNRSRVGEIPIHLHRYLRVVKAVLHLHVKHGILCGEGRVNRHEDRGDEEQAEDESCLERHAQNRAFHLLANRGKSGAELRNRFAVHGDG